MMKNFYFYEKHYKLNLFHTLHIVRGFKILVQDGIPVA